MGEGKPCCPESAARRVKKVSVDGVSVGIARLDQIIAEVRALGTDEKETVDRELLKRLKIYNYVPKGTEGAYLEAIRKEYD